MKTRRLLALLLTMALLCVLLSGCVFLSGCDNGEVDMVPFDEMVYERPELDTALRDVDALIADIESGAKLRRVRAGLDDCFDVHRHLRTMEAISTIRSDADVTDDYYRGEMEYCTDALITYRAKLEELFAACAASKLRDDLDSYLGEGFLDDYGEDYVFPETLFSLQKQENDLINRYFAALAAQRYSLNGRDYTIDELYLADRDGTLEGVTLEDAVNDYYLSANEALGGIFCELIKVRHALAAEAGYDSFLDMAYDQNYRDYSPAEAAVFTEAVRTKLVPLYREAVESGVADDGYYGTEPIDSDDALMTVMDIAEAMGGDIADTAAFLMEYDLVNADVSDRKVSDSYELYIPDYESPYILAGTIGYGEDILTIAHELGHAVDDFVHYEADDSTDVSETLSQALEYLTIPYLQDDSLHDAVLAYKLTDALRMYAEQGSYNAFEEQVYALADEDVTLENVNAIAARCAKDFGVQSEWGEGYDARSWVEITHFFQQPLYIVSYLASDALAVQFYEQELAQEGVGLRLYKDAIERAGDTAFLQLPKKLGLRDPLSAEQVEAIAKLMREALFQ